MTPEPEATDTYILINQDGERINGSGGYPTTFTTMRAAETWAATCVRMNGGTANVYKLMRVCEMARVHFSDPDGGNSQEHTVR